jgi:hypothetical protein
MRAELGRQRNLSAAIRANKFQGRSAFLAEFRPRAVFVLAPRANHLRSQEKIAQARVASTTTGGKPVFRLQFSSDTSGEVESFCATRSFGDGAEAPKKGLRVFFGQSGKKEDCGSHRGARSGHTETSLSCRPTLSANGLPLLPQQLSDQSKA